MYSIHEDDIDLKQLKGRKYKLLASRDTLGCENMCAGVSFFPPGKHAPGHIHDKEEEIIYCLEGTGELVIDGHRENLQPGTIAYVPSKSLHSVNNTGDDTIKLFFVYSPSAKLGAYKDYDSE